jgi:hypothetical protein
MDIKLFGYEMRFELVIAFILIGMFMGLVMFCDCFQYSLIEGMTNSIIVDLYTSIKLG